MGVLVGVEVGRIATGQPAEGVDLAAALDLDRYRVVGVAALIGEPPLAVPKAPLGDIEMKSDGEAGLGVDEIGRRSRGIGPDHQAGAGDDAAFVGLGDASVDSGREAEI